MFTHQKLNVDRKALECAGSAERLSDKVSDKISDKEDALATQNVQTPVPAGRQGKIIGARDAMPGELSKGHRRLVMDEPELFDGLSHEMEFFEVVGFDQIAIGMQVIRALNILRH